MSDTPINVFGRSVDAAGIARVVENGLDGATLQAEGTGFIVTVAPKRRLRRAAGREVTVNVRLDYFEDAAGQRQVLGMSNFVRSNMGGPGIAYVLSAIPELRVAVAFMAKPPVAPEPHDELFQLALAVAAAANGFVLSIEHGQVWSGDGRLLASTELAQPVVSSAPVDDQDPDDDFAPDPPPVDRVIRRLLVLTAVAARGLAEAEGRYLNEARTGILGWVGGLDLDDELEPAERRLITAAAGEVLSMDQVTASWRTEGAAVLAWAVGLLELSRHDVPIDPVDLSRVIGFPDVSTTSSLIAPLSLKAPEELGALADRLFAVHWRLREHSLRPRSMNFAEFARTAWFGPLDIDGVPVLDNDLAVVDLPLMDADASDVAVATSVVMERHLAANWLREGGIYSETDTST